MPANGRSCGKCDYYSTSTTDTGWVHEECAIAPNRAQVDANYWCGQYKPNKEKLTTKHESKGKYGQLQNVRLTQDECAKLMVEFGANRMKEMIDNLSRYIGSHGDKYRSHYATLLNWEAKHAKENSVQQGPVY